MHTRLLALSFASCSILAATAAGCGSKANSGFASPNGTDDGGVARDDSGSFADDGGSSFDDGGDDAGDAGCVTQCSADLHDVVDCQGNVLTHCPSDQGCAPDGTCIAACDAAKANKSTLGCDYYSVDPGTDGQANGSCFAAYIANTWTSDVTLTVDYAGQTLDVSKFAYIPSGQGQSITYAPLPNGKLPAGQLAILFLADIDLQGVDYTRCPQGVTAAYTAAEASSQQTGILHAFHVTSSAPVVAADIFPYGGSHSYITSATLLIPTSAWDTNYVAVDAFARSVIAGPNAQPFVEVTAMEDATHVTISPTAPIIGGNGVQPTGKGKPVTYTLNRGEVLQLKQDMELNGSPIQADKPIGVWGGSSCMNIDVFDPACDSGHQELVPVRALGHEYVAVRYRNRGPTDEQPPWRIVGAVDGTTLTYEPSTPPGAPTALSSGQIAMFYASGPFVVKSQDAKHPFYFGAHMGGENFRNQDNGSTGDPEWVNVIPPQQYLSSYVFMTDPTMADTNLVMVREKASDQTFKDVRLDCSGTVTGWQPAGASGRYEYARVDLVTNGQGVGGCNNGRHEIRSDAPFALTVWGWDRYVSYAYPAGESVQPINTVIVPPLPK
jgi:hypothetical protein